MSTAYEVQCRGLPWEATEQELRDFFGNNGIESLEIPRRNGRTSGDAKVVFTNEEDYNNALKKDREHLGSRYIEVFPAGGAPTRRGDRGERGDRGDRDHYRSRGAPPRDRYSDRGGPRSSGPDSIVRLRGLPFSVTSRDISDFLAPLPIVRDGILLPDQQRARPGGEAYVCFETMESVQIAKQRHMKNIGHRYIEVFEATHRDLSRFAEENDLRVPRFGPPPFASAPQTAPRGAYDPYSQPTDPYRNATDYRRAAEPEDPYARSRAPSVQDYGVRASYDPYTQPAAPVSSYPSQQQPSAGYYDNYAPKTAYESYGRERGPDPRDVRDPRDSRMPDPRDSRALSDPYAAESSWRSYAPIRIRSS
ncbi:RRM domain-containing protein [Caenorhabditis elegans]|uniref:RRM domain-containing protein n=1 Tax=Caenorhabditis elegans TaxID=6239 RepID=H2KZN0_CAEEL|nr:RRM domain-containing protein [Caenorhabditis elegans]CCD68996.1 RRM domain-containing protein [Caenorhabditis elegans]|eukprot:NP_740878.1 HnRNP F homolog [Caenorhabditis elegans]